MTKKTTHFTRQRKILRNTQLEKNNNSCYKERVNHFIKTSIGKPAQWLIEAASSIGLDYSELSHETTTELITHSIKRHGNPSIHGRATVVNKDFEFIPYIIKAPDYAIIGAIRKKTLFNVYTKAKDGITFFYFEEVLKSRKNKALRGKTLYKVTRELSLDEIKKNVTINKKTDITNAYILDNKNVQTAGGYPGG